MKSQNKVKHTQGPWKVKQTAVYDAVYGNNDELVSFISIKQPEEIQANARLIAAAPELLEACVKFQTWAKEFCKTNNLPEEAFYPLVEVNRAILKAEGKS